MHDQSHPQGHLAAGGRVSMRCETRLTTITYSLEVPMYHVAGVEVAEALSDVRELATGVSVE